ncbi:MAG TPA: hypothetical protein VLT32_07750, partial [Candidatus Sulfomarinibacteraceae bacterium]|nr:hypothetical protein [Candidatus Sulfomarinibacteraceae bacterium]
MSDRHDDRINRRELLRIAVIGAGGAVAHSLAAPAAHAIAGEATMMDAAFAPLDVVRVGFVGVGLMGTSHVENVLRIEGVELRAVCDVVESKVARAQQMAVDAGQARPAGYS